MAIRVSYPTDKRRPGSGAEFDFVSGSQGLVPASRAILCIGIAKGGTVAQHVPTQVFADKDAEDYFGTGLELTLMLRKALETGRKLGAVPQVWGIGIDENAGGVAATGTFTITGPATAAGDIVIRIAGRTVRSTVAVGAVQNDIAAALKLAVDKAAKDLPVTAGVAANVVTLTARAKGLFGNDVALEVVSKPAGVGITPVAMAAGAGVVSIITALDAALTRDYYGIAIGNHAAQDITDWAAHVATAWGTMIKRFRYLFMGERGALATAQTLSAAANSEKVVVGSYPSSPSPSFEIAAALACLSQVHEQPNYNRNGTVLPLYPPALASVLNDAQIESALGSGLTPLTVDTTEQFAKVERLVTTRTTVSSAPFEGLLDFGNSWALAKFAKELDPLITRAIEGKNIDDNLLGDVKAVVRRSVRQRGNDGWFTDVETLLQQLKVEKDPAAPTRVLLEIPEKPTPIANQVITKHVMIT
jgi:phage tail sheath gpL-like